MATISLRVASAFFRQGGSGEPCRVVDGQHVVTTADSHGAWTIVVQQTLTDGTYDYTVKTTDVAGHAQWLQSPCR
ncbi:hypothetical protein J4727_18010 [Providencia rettgeri]|uniref:Bacterial Ig-like domain-containing protein n=1 Tax=Providencia rettgeri TaxID=587 RepID=A0A939SLY3_PRORE|nr:hypothetical protein [Providencia rettgeri]